MPRHVTEPTYRRFVEGKVRRFDEADHAFSRLIRGEYIPLDQMPKGHDVRSAIHSFFRFDPTAKARHGYSRSDYAMRRAGRTIDYLVRTSVDGREMVPDQPPVLVDDPARLTELVKANARHIGADVVGVASVNRDWLFSRWGDHSARGLKIHHAIGDPVVLPERYNSVVVMAVAMDYDVTRRSPTMEFGTDLGYSHLAFLAPTLARFIMEMGFHAIPSTNSWGLNIPLAVDAGLGELGRNGLLITDPHGPRVRICKVFTDMPLVPDRPVDLGVQAFCETCKRCAASCPSRSITDGDRTAESIGGAVNSGVRKWPVDPESCMGWWIKNRSHCSNCIRVCPFNKLDTPLHRAVRWQVAHLPALNRVARWADEKLGYGRQTWGDRDREFWPEFRE